MFSSLSPISPALVRVTSIQGLAYFLTNTSFGPAPFLLYSFLLVKSPLVSKSDLLLFIYFFLKVTFTYMPMKSTLYCEGLARRDRL